MIDKDIILEELKSLDYVWVGSEIRRGWFFRLLGWNCYSSSVIRKTSALKRLQEHIEQNHLPLEIKDEPEMSNAFRVLIKDAA